MPPGPSGNNPVNRPTSSSSTPPPGSPAGAPGRPPNSLPTERFLPPVEPRKTVFARIVDLPPLSEISYDQYDADDESDNSLDLGCAEGKPPISLKQTKFSLKQFAKRMGQANCSMLNKWRKGWGAEFLEKWHRSIIWGQNRLKQLRDGPLHWETAVAEFLETFETCLPLDNFDNSKWIRPQWVEMFLKKCASEIWKARKKERRGNKRLAMDMGERGSKKARTNLPALSNTTVMVVIGRVSNGKDIVLSPNQLQSAYTDMRHLEELIDFINKNGRPKESYTLTSRFKCTLEKDELDQEYMGLYTNGQMITDPISGQISYNSWLWNALKLKLRDDHKISLIEMKRATGKEIAEHIIRPAKEIPASRVKARCAQLLIVVHTLWKVLTRVEERRERRMVGKRMILVLM